MRLTRLRHLVGLWYCAGGADVIYCGRDGGHCRSARRWERPCSNALSGGSDECQVQRLCRGSFDDGCAYFSNEVWPGWLQTPVSPRSLSFPTILAHSERFWAQGFDREARRKTNFSTTRAPADSQLALCTYKGTHTCREVLCLPLHTTSSNSNSNSNSKDAAVAAQGAPMRRPSTPLLDHARASSPLAVQQENSTAAADHVKTQCLRHGVQRSSTSAAGAAESGAQPCL